MSGGDAGGSRLNTTVAQTWKRAAEGVPDARLQPSSGIRKAHLQIKQSTSVNKSERASAPEKALGITLAPFACLFVCLFVLLITASFAITSPRRMKWRHSECSCADRGRQPVPLAGLLVFREQSLTHRQIPPDQNGD